MTLFFREARKQMACTLFIAVSLLLPGLTKQANADALDDAIKQAISAEEAPLFPRSIMARSQALRFMRLSPDGGKIAYSLERNRVKELWLYDVAENSHSLLFNSKLADQIIWSSDSRHIFLKSKQGIAAVLLAEPQTPSFVINLDNDKEEMFYRVDPTHPHAVIVSKQMPDKAGHVFYRVLPTGEKEELFSSTAYVGDVLPAGDKRMFAVRIKGTALEVIQIEDTKETHLMDCESASRELHSKSFRLKTQKKPI